MSWSTDERGEVTVEVGRGPNGLWRVYSDGEVSPGLLAQSADRGYLGVHVVDLSPELRAHYGVTGDAGVMVSRVAPESPAFAAGVSVGDVIVAFASEPVSTGWSLKQLVAGRRAGEVVQLELIRSGEELRLEVEMAEGKATVLELREFFQLGKEGDIVVGRPPVEWRRRLPAPLVEVEGEQQLEEAFEGALHALEEPALRRRIEEELRQREELERRLEAMEQRLRELERQLEDDG